MRMPFFPPIGDRGENTGSIEHAPGEIDAARAVLAMAMRALLPEEELMARRDHFGVLEIRRLASVKSPGHDAEDEHHARESRYLPHRPLRNAGAACFGRRIALISRS
jgi:hypothetical protein